MTDEVFFVHPTAIVESKAIGCGSSVWAFTHVMKGATIGRECNIGGHCFIESGAVVGDRTTIKNGVSLWDGVIIEDDVFVGPNAVFTNDARPRSPRSAAGFQRYATRKWLQQTVIRSGATIGANATIVCGNDVGGFALVAAGSVVTRPVPPHALVAGVPGRVTGWVSESGARLSFDERFVAFCSETQTSWQLSGDRLVQLATEGGAGNR